MKIHADTLASKLSKNAPAKTERHRNNTMQTFSVKTKDIEIMYSKTKRPQ